MFLPFQLILDIQTGRDGARVHRLVDLRLWINDKENASKIVVLVPRLIFEIVAINLALVRMFSFEIEKLYKHFHNYYYA